MKNLKSLLGIFSALIIISCTNPATENKNTSEYVSSDYIVLGYISEGKDWRKHDIEVEKLTHIN